MEQPTEMDWLQGADQMAEQAIDGYDANVTESEMTPYSMGETLFLSMTLLIIIVGTIVGNILVCTAVCLVSRLRRPCNYLLVSLAVSDLCVALLVMPMALVYEVMGTWPFGVRVCDAWVACDVLSCTASILNLCMISVDRYWAITRPLDYGVKRTPTRMLFCVALVWLLAACISLPPLLVLGNDHGADGLQCVVCQAFGYQIYATLGSFYIPLGVMAGVYYKIFQAAKRIVDEEKKAQIHLLNQPAKKTERVGLIVKAEYRRSQSSSVTCHQLINHDADSDRDADHKKHRTSLDSAASSTVKSTEWKGQHPAANQQQQRRRPSWPEDWTSGSQTRASLDIPRYRRYSSTLTEINDTSIDASLANGSHQEISLVVGNGNSNNSSNNNQSQRPSSTVETAALYSANRKPPAHKMRLRFALAKERKASTTLGIIMSAFTLCWLPFFVLALVRPFMTQPDLIPRWLSSLFLWLGYANSFLNPVIYATTNKDFRLPFKEILCLRCKSLNSIMREEFYQSQFGEARGQTSANLPGDISQSHSPRCPSKYQVSQPVTAEAQLI